MSKDKAAVDLKALEELARTSASGIARYDSQLYVTYYSKSGTIRLWGRNGKRLRRSEALEYLATGRT